MTGGLCCGGFGGVGGWLGTGSGKLGWCYAVSGIFV